jgi:BTB And C-terminal Kelch
MCVVYLRGMLTVDCSITFLIQVVAAASYLQISELLNECGEWFIRKLAQSTWLRTLQLSYIYGLQDVRQAVYKYIVKNFSSHRKLLRLSALRKLSLEDICTIIDDDDINAKEKDIFNVALSWLKCNGKANDQSVPRILSVIRFPMMSVAELEMCAIELSALSLPVDLYGQLLEESKLLTAGSKNCVLTERQMQPRCLIEVVLALGGFTTKEYSTSRMQLLLKEDFMNAAERVSRGEVDSIRLLLVLCD